MYSAEYVLNLEYTLGSREFIPNINFYFSLLAEFPLIQNSSFLPFFNWHIVGYNVVLFLGLQRSDSILL